MAKKIKTIVKMQLPAGKATPAPPVGTALGPHGLNLGEFCTKFNAATKAMGDDIVPLDLTIYEDRTYSMKLKTPPASNLLMKAAGISKGSGKPLSEKVGKVKKSQVRAIAEQKMPDLNANSIEAAIRTLAGTARSAGIDIVD